MNNIRIENFLTWLIPNISSIRMLIQRFLLAFRKFRDAFLKFHIPLKTISIRRNLEYIRGTTGCRGSSTIKTTTLSPVSIFIKLSTGVVLSQQVYHYFVGKCVWAVRHSAAFIKTTCPIRTNCDFNLVSSRTNQGFICGIID